MENEATMRMPGVSPDAPTPEDPREERRDDARRWLTFTVLIAVVIILFLLMLRSCVPAAVSAGDVNGGKRIGGVVPPVRDTYSVAIWCRPGVDAAEVLKRNGLSAKGMVEFSDGAIVVPIGNRDPEKVVARLQADKGLYDAGFVKNEDGATWSWQTQ